MRTGGIEKGRWGRKLPFSCRLLLDAFWEGSRSTCWMPKECAFGRFWPTAMYTDHSSKAFRDKHVAKETCLLARKTRVATFQALQMWYKSINFSVDIKQFKTHTSVSLWTLNEWRWRYEVSWLPVVSWVSKKVNQICRGQQKWATQTAKPLAVISKLGKADTARLYWDVLSSIIAPVDKALPIFPWDEHRYPKSTQLESQLHTGLMNAPIHNSHVQMIPSSRHCPPTGQWSEHSSGW